MDRYRGVELDSTLRVSRIGYPAVAWAVSLGHAPSVKWSLVVTNVLGFTLLGLAGSVLARNRGRPAVLGLLIATSSGLVMSLSRDLTEVVMVAALVGGVALIAQQHFHLAAVAWAMATLTHEQSLFCIIPYAIYRVVQIVRRRSMRPTASDLPWIAAVVAFGSWQLVCRAAVGRFPMFDSGDATLDVPFRGLVTQSWRWIQDGLERQQLLVVPQLMLLVTLVVFAFRSTKHLRVDDQWLRWALAGASIIGASLSRNVWIGPAELRQVVVLSTVAWLVIICANKPIPRALINASLLVLISTAALRTVAI